VEPEGVPSLLQAVDRVAVPAALEGGVGDGDGGEPSRMGSQHLADVVVVLVEGDQHGRPDAMLRHDRQEVLDRGVALGGRQRVDAAGADAGRAEDVRVGVDDHRDLILRGPR
jgi:hypothetical protein